MGLSIRDVAFSYCYSRHVFLVHHISFGVTYIVSATVIRLVETLILTLYPLIECFEARESAMHVRNRTKQHVAVALVHRFRLDA